MDLTSVERSRTGLVQFLIILIMAFLALIVIVAWSSEQANLIRGLSVLSLLTCLYVIAKERHLKKEHDQVLDKIAEKRQQLSLLDRELAAEKDESSKLELRLQELTALYRAISAVNAVVEHEQTFDAVLLAALDLVGGDCGSLMMVDGDRGRLEFVSAVGLDKDVIDRADQKIGDGIAGWVALHAEPVHLTGPVDGDERFQNVVVREAELNVAISIPLRLGDDVIGVMNLGSASDSEKWSLSEDDYRFAYIFAQHAAIAIERARLLQEA